ncbi:MAG: hypothetical protein AB1779_09535 [Candidatus Thermoplasmatota archaeon]
MIEANCPSCGKPIGDRKACNYCGAYVEKRLRIKTMFISSIASLLIGFILLSLAFITTTPIEKVTELTSNKNFQHVRVVGKVVDVIYTKEKYEKYGSMSIFVNDRSLEKYDANTIKIRADADVVEKIVDKKKVVAFGDKVDVEGTLYAGPGYKVLNLNDEKMFRVEKRNYEEIMLDEFKNADENKFERGKMIRSYGFVSGLRTLDFATIVYLEDSELQIFIEKHVIELTGKEKIENITIGKKITFEGSLEWYKGKGKGYWEVIIPTMENIKIEEVSYEAVTVEQLLNKPEKYEGRKVKLMNVFVVDVYQTWKFKVADNSSSKKNIVVYGAKIDKIEVGDILIVKGTFKYYKDGGYWEIEVGKGDEVIKG